MEKNKFLEIKKAKKGHGLFLKKDVELNKKILKLEGDYFDVKIEPTLSKEVIANSIRYSKEIYLDTTKSYSKYLNHSCMPNSYILKEKGNLFLVVLNKINHGEELTIDYSTIIALDDFWKMDCNCGGKNCRKKIGNWTTLPKTIFQQYLLRGMIPDYILEI